MTWIYDVKSVCLIGVKVNEKFGPEIAGYALLNERGKLITDKILESYNSVEIKVMLS